MEERSPLPPSKHRVKFMESEIRSGELEEVYRFVSLRCNKLDLR